MTNPMHDIAFTEKDDEGGLVGTTQEPVTGLVQAAVGGAGAVVQEEDEDTRPVDLSTRPTHDRLYSVCRLLPYVRSALLRREAQRHHALFIVTTLYCGSGYIHA